MACISASKKAMLLEQLTRVNTQIEKANDTLDRAIEAMDVEEYSFNSNEGTQKTKQADITKIEKLLETLYSRRDRILRQLQGRGLVNMNLRRKRYGRIY